MLDERWVFHENAKAEPAGEGVVRRVLAYSRILCVWKTPLRQGTEGKPSPPPPYSDHLCCKRCV